MLRTVVTPNAMENVTQGTTATRPASGLLAIQARVFEAVASTETVTGAIDELARQFGGAPATFVDCLSGLIDAGWVTITTLDDDLVNIQLKP